MIWIPDRWQEDLLWHFIRTGDFWCGRNENLYMNPSLVLIMVGGDHGDQKKLYAIKYFLYGGVRRASDYYRGPSLHPWENLWISDEFTEEYLRWWEDKWATGRIIDAHNRRRRVKECIRIYDESH